MVFDENELIADRSQLRLLRQQHPNWSLARLAKELGHCRNWVKKWLRRIATAAPDDQLVLHKLSNVPRKPPPPPPALLLDRLLEFRDHPPQDLKRVPGPKTLLYFLKQDQVLKEARIVPPASPSTIYRWLVRLGCIARPLPRKPKELERPEPLECIALDFKDASTVTIEPDGKKQHTIEVLNLVDEGTSVLWEAVVRPDFNAQSVVETLLDIFTRQGKPKSVRFDRDTRFVGARQNRDFPSAMVRMLYVLDITPHLCPPHRPDKNPFVERYNGSFKRECLLVHRPADEAAVREVTAVYKEHYNWVRPHQGKSCGNRPPRVAFPELPPLPSLPLVVDPDCWLLAVNGRHFVRKVQSNGAISIDKYDYFVGAELAGKYVVARVEATTRELLVDYKEQLVKKLPLKGLYGRSMRLDEYKEAIVAESKSEQRGWQPFAK